MISDTRTSWVLKPAVHAACILPITLLIWAAFSDNLGANPIEAINRELGEWALRFLLMALAITPLRQLTRWNGFSRFRRLLGLWAFAYVSLHLSSYIVLDHFFNWSDIWSDIVKRTFITVGMFTFVLLLSLAITSTKGWVRRLGRRWQKLHRLVYLASFAGVVHFYMMVKADTREPLIYVGVVIILLGWRVVTALLRRLRRAPSSHPQKV